MLTLFEQMCLLNSLPLSMVGAAVVALDSVVWCLCPCNHRLWILPGPMTRNRLHCVGQSMWHRFHAFYSRCRMDSVKLVQNRNKSLFAVSLDLHHARAQSILAMLHPAKCKFVTHSMAHCHAETHWVSDDDRWNKIHATTMDTSTDRGWKHKQIDLFVIKILINDEIFMSNALYLPFHGRFVWSAAVSLLVQSSIRCRPFFVSFCCFEYSKINWIFIWPS